ncbi:hypothetical protein [Streptosporangium sp. KLBMP 9127]|nr:hypothetical protein [Streptosporangium sp. KLBMP 9127]
MSYDPNQPPYPGQPYGQMPKKVTAVSKRRGLGGLSHTAHLMLTIFTCGMWGIFVWLPWWLFRMVKPKKTKTTYRYK